jgi:hypothetical protein
MPGYKINIRTASHIADALDVDTESLTDLRLEMAKFVGELLKDHAALLWKDQDWQIDVSDNTGLILYAIQITALETSATSGTLRRV